MIRGVDQDATRHAAGCLGGGTYIARRRLCLSHLDARERRAREPQRQRERVQRVAAQRESVEHDGASTFVVCRRAREAARGAPRSFRRLSGESEEVSFLPCSSSSRVFFSK